ncbi:hypothetical protein [Dechloromonas denitrificans]|uniref:hypothetical protein n=1 Tax=Dechloromonas denitrificans TaxID=281362 RepID=UPI001969E56F|nr:hypothetical protein [Dechloromonas denitrificans]
MALLKHEIWIDSDGLPSLCLAGPMGDGFRSLQEHGAALIGLIDATSHFEAMTKYYEIMGWGVYTTDFESDHESYSEEWRSIQDGAKDKGQLK